MITQSKASSDGSFSTFILNAIPSPIFVVEEDVCIVDYNDAAEKMLNQDRSLVLRHRAGDVLHCIHSTETPEGCGRAPQCSECVVRNSVNAALQGATLVRQTAPIELLANGKIQEALFLITAVALDYGVQKLALLILEDITELTLLRRMLPICAGCKQIRDDKNYWHAVEQYLESHCDLTFSHSLCPECAAKTFPEYFDAEGNELRPPKA